MHLNQSNSDIEFQIIEVKIGHVKKSILINCYRPPSGNISECFTQLENAFDKIIKLEEYELYLNGDFNIAYNQTNTNEFRKLKQFERKYNLTQLINTPTRCTASTRNILDLMLTTSNSILASGSEDLNISDHQPVWLIRKKQMTKTPLTTFSSRCYTNFDKQEYQSELVARNWNEYYSEICPNKLWAELETAITNLADKHCPYKTYKQRLELPPWLTHDLLDLIHIRDKCYKLAKKTNLPNDWIEARRARNLCNKGVKDAKNQYVKNQLSDHEKSPKKFWQIIENTWSPDKQKDVNIQLTDVRTGRQIDPENVPIPLIAIFAR